ncbi:hypothetical protein EDB86DRAFT_2836667 [Lactarius hatsudake]|nr:hypothetical protein EDB86DRAFT_2836667 [Lactarius hatsudake]
MPPQRRTLVDLLTEDEKVFMGAAIRIFSALRYREKNKITTEDEWYVECITSELDDLSPFFEKPEYEDARKLRIHPIITYVGEEWLKATEEKREPDITNLDLADVVALCDDVATKHLSWNAQLHMKNLDALVGLQKEGDRWWLPAKPSGNVAASAVAGLNTEPVSTSVRDTTTVNEDVEMEDDDGGETPRKAGKRPEVQSPTPVRRVSSRRRKADSGDPIAVSSPESESGGRMPARPAPAVRPPTSRVPAEPAAESSGDEVKAPGARRKRKRRESVFVDESASEKETGLTDPGACGPCKMSHHKCKPQVRTKGLACRLCIKRKAKCDPLSAVSQAIVNSRKKKHTLEDVLERLDSTSRAQEMVNTAVRDFMFNTDTVLRALCTHGPGKVNLASLGLRLPAVPLFADAEPSTPGASSVASRASGASGASGAPSSVSSLGVSRMMIENAGVAGPSEPAPEYEEIDPVRAGLRRRASRSGTSSKVPSRAGSRQSSRGHK